MSKIIKEVISTLSVIKNLDSTEINGTREIVNRQANFFPHRTDLEDERKQVALFYQNNIGDWQARCDLERNHYKFLRAFIIHKIGEVLYFHRQESMTSRKFVIWSNDCISCIQFLHREEGSTINIFIRSSDVLNLLPCDYLFGCELLDEILAEFNLPANDNDAVCFFTTSSHYYLKDEAKVEKILYGALND